MKQALGGKGGGKGGGGRGGHAFAPYMVHGRRLRAVGRLPLMTDSALLCHEYRFLAQSWCIALRLAQLL